MIQASPSPELALLRDALGPAADAAKPLSREPLGRGSVVGFELSGPDQGAVVYVDTSAIRVDVETGLALPGVGRIWTHPADPHLPALAPAAFGHAVGTLLERVGIEVVADPVMIAYRPGRRAVLRVDTRQGRRWIKIVRPSRVERIARLHATLREAGLPVPAVTAWSPRGLIVIEEAAGTPASRAAWTPTALLDAVDDLRARLATVQTATTVAGSTARADWYAARIIAVEGSWRERIEALASRTRVTDGDASSTVHGDLHFGQLFLDSAGARITGLVDVDTVGRGHPAEDPAAFLAHAITSLHMSSADDARSRLRELVSAADVRWAAMPGVGARVAAQLLGYVVAALDAGERERALALLDEAEMRAPMADRT